MKDFYFSLLSIVIFHFFSKSVKPIDDFLDGGWHWRSGSILDCAIFGCVYEPEVLCCKQLLIWGLGA
jgi:hypothetical protein